MATDGGEMGQVSDSALVNVTCPGNWNQSALKGHGEPKCVNYKAQIEELELAITSILIELAKNNVRLTKFKLDNAFRNNHKSNGRPSYLDYMEEHLKSRPNDRFAFKPGTCSRDQLHKRRVRTPFQRQCTGCLFNLKQNGPIMGKGKSTDDILKKWNHSSTPYLAYSSSLLPARSYIALRKVTSTRRQHTDAGKDVATGSSHAGLSTTAGKSTHSEESVWKVKGSSTAAHISSTAYIVPSVSTNESLTSLTGQHTSRTRLLEACERRREVLKAYQAEETKLCDQKVKTFIQKIKLDCDLARH